MNTITDLDVIEKQLISSTPFGTGDRPAQRREYRRLARLLHPDTRQEVDSKHADYLFRQLESLWTKLTSPTPPLKWEISTRHHHYVVIDPIGPVGCANEYKVVWMEDRDPHYGRMRLPRSPRDNDLIDSEIKALQQLNKDVDEQYSPYFPRLIDKFRHRDINSRIDRRGLIIEELPDCVISLSELHKKIPQLDPRDMAWIFRRLLTALGAAHRAGIINGAILPDYVLIEPVDHGVILPVWQYSTSEAPISAIPNAYRDWYPPEVLKKDHPTEATDIYLAAKLHDYMTGWVTGKDGKALRAFMSGCMSGTQRARPNDAWQILDEYTRLIEQLWGPRKFRVLNIPN